MRYSELKTKNEQKKTVEIDQEVYSQEKGGDSPPAFEFQRTRGINRQALFPVRENHG